MTDLRQDYLLIRPMLLADVPAVSALDQMAFSLPWPERSFRYEVTENEHSRPWVAEVSDTAGNHYLAAMAVIWVIVDEAHVATFAVHADQRRKGIGRQLLAVTLLEAAKEGALLSHLEVRRSNLAAQALYADFGYQVVGLRPRYYQDNFEDALLMTLSPINIARLEGCISPNTRLMSGGSHG